MTFGGKFVNKYVGMSTIATLNNAKCYHCGNPIERLVLYDTKHFCCSGCKSVYQLLVEHDLTNFYSIDNQNTTTPKHPKKLSELAFLDEEQVVSKLLDYQGQSVNKVTFKAPAIHCSSCIWLLENLYKIDAGILRSEVNFINKQIHIDYNPEKLSLKELVFLLSTIGYEPDLTLEDVTNRKNEKTDMGLWYKLGVAGFAFGNVMLFSLPTYFGLEADGVDKDFDVLFKFLNLSLAIPVLFYSASEFLQSAFISLKSKQINLDVPLCLGILALFGSSVYEILSGTGPGYLDSFTALIFFLLAGRAFQKSSLSKLRFDRDNSSYFPLSAIRLVDGEEFFTPVTTLQQGDIILVRNKELVPADGRLLSVEADIDYSFVTGEAIPAKKRLGDIVYAGGRQLGSAVKVQIIKEPSKSYLNQLWNTQKFDKPLEEDYESVVNKRSKYFTYAVLVVAFSALIYWSFAENIAKGILVFATTLNVSCPCALAVAIPFTYAYLLKRLGEEGFYLKNPTIIERISKIDTIVFDKTGTITDVTKSKISWEGKPLNDYQIRVIKGGLRQSIHPLSVQLYNFLQVETPINEIKCEEFVSKGLVIKTDDLEIKVGAHHFVGGKFEDYIDNKTSVYISINEKPFGRFVFDNTYLPATGALINNLVLQGYDLHLLSGDNASEEQTLLNIFPTIKSLHFNQKPEGKWNFIQNLQSANKQVMMVGDGLNDSVALKQSEVGVAVVNQNTQFSPSSDAIIEQDKLVEMDKFIRYCKSGLEVIKRSFIFSSIYNAIGLSVAVQGLFSPVFAAILMPISSITVVLFSIWLSDLSANRIFRVKKS